MSTTFSWTSTFPDSFYAAPQQQQQQLQQQQQQQQRQDEINNNNNNNNKNSNIDADAAADHRKLMKEPLVALELKEWDVVLKQGDKEGYDPTPATRFFKQHVRGPFFSRGSQEADETARLATDILNSARQCQKEKVKVLKGRGRRKTADVSNQQEQDEEVLFWVSAKKVEEHPDWRHPTDDSVRWMRKRPTKSSKNNEEQIIELVRASNDCIAHDIENNRLSKQRKKRKAETEPDTRAAVKSVASSSTTSTATTASTSHSSSSLSSGSSEDNMGEQQSRAATPLSAVTFSPCDPRLEDYDTLLTDLATLCDKWRAQYKECPDYDRQYLLYTVTRKLQDDVKAYHGIPEQPTHDNMPLPPKYKDLQKEQKDCLVMFVNVLCNRTKEWFDDLCNGSRPNSPGDDRSSSNNNNGNQGPPPGNGSGESGNNSGHPSSKEGGLGGRQKRNDKSSRSNANKGETESKSKQSADTREKSAVSPNSNLASPCDAQSANDDNNNNNNNKNRLYDRFDRLTERYCIFRRTYRKIQRVASKRKVDTTAHSRFGPHNDTESNARRHSDGIIDRDRDSSSNGEDFNAVVLAEEMERWTLNSEQQQQPQHDSLSDKAQNFEPTKKPHEEGEDQSVEPVEAENPHLEKETREQDTVARMPSPDKENDAALVAKLRGLTDSALDDSTAAIYPEMGENDVDDAAFLYHEYNATNAWPHECDDAIVEGQSYCPIDSERLADPDMKCSAKSSDYSVFKQAGCLREMQGNFAAAQEMFEKCCSVQEYALGPDNLEVADSYVDLGRVLFLQGLYEESMEKFMNALHIREQWLPEDNLDIAQIYFYMGRLLHETCTEGPDEALAMMQKCHAIQDEKLGEHDHATAVTCSYIGLFLVQSGVDGAWEQGLEMARNALDVLEKTAGGDHPDTAFCHFVVATCLKDTDDVDEALSMAEQCRTVQEMTLGKKHLFLAKTHALLGELLRKKGQPLESISHFQKALEIYESGRQEDHIVLARICAHLSVAVFTIHDAKQARQWHSKVLLSLKGCGNRFDQELIVIYSRGGVDFFENGEHDKAIAVFRQSLGLMAAMLGRDHSALADGHDAIGLALCTKGDFEAGLEEYNRSLMIKRASMKWDDPSIIESERRIEEMKASILLVEKPQAEIPDAAPLKPSQKCPVSASSAKPSPTPTNKAKHASINDPVATGTIAPDEKTCQQGLRFFNNKNFRQSGLKSVSSPDTVATSATTSAETMSSLSKGIDHAKNNMPSVIGYSSSSSYSEVKVTKTNSQ